MCVFVCVMLCLFFVTVQYFDMFCFYFGLQQQQQFAWPSTLQQSTAWLLSLSPSLAQLCSLLMISLFGIRCAVLNLRYQIALLAKNTKRHTDKRQKSQKKKQLNLFIFSLHSFCGIFFSYIFLYSLIPFSR